MAPVPEIVWTLTVRFSWIAGEAAPRISFAAAEVKEPNPVIGRYSWSRESSLNKRWLAYNPT